MPYERYGDLFLDLNEFKKWGDHCPCVKATDLYSAIGFEGAFMIEKGYIFCPIDDKEKLDSALDTCGYKMTEKGLFDGLEYHTPESNSYWLLIAESFDAYWGIEIDSYNGIITIQTLESGDMSFDGWQADEKIILGDGDIFDYAESEYIE